MQAHPQDTAEAVDVRSSELTDDAAAASIDTIFADPDEEGEAGEPETDEEADADEADAETEDDGDDTDGDDEPDAPAIDAPVSLTAEEKAVFAQLPTEAQQAWAASENRRNQQVQQATTRAADAQRQAQAAAASADAEAKAAYVEQLRAFTAHYAPQPPNPALARQDYPAFVALDAQYRADAAQHQQLVQQIEALSGEAQKQIEEQTKQAIAADWRTCGDELPEATDVAQWQGLMSRLTTIAEHLGYDQERIAAAYPTDVRALKRVAALKDKADKWDAAQARKMQRVRDARTAKPNAAKPVKNSQERQISEATARFKASGSDADAARALEMIGF